MLEVRSIGSVFPVVRASLLNIVSTWTSGCGEVLPQVEESCRGYKCSAKIPAPARHTVFTCVPIVDVLRYDVVVVVGR